jgi:hypothetical protein
VYAALDGSFPSTSAGTRTYDRPNIKITRSLFAPYAEQNLAIMNMLHPVRDTNELCMPDYTPVEAIVTNLGNEDYNYSQNPVTVSVEIINSQGRRDTAFVIKRTGMLKYRESDTIQLIPSLPIMYAGITYDVKAWLTSQVDNIPYDDTLSYKFTSGRIGLPIDEDFSNREMSNQLISIPIVGAEAWSPYIDTTFHILPPSGNGMLRYVGSYGSMSTLTTRQLDLNGVVDPELKFWYYHDATTSDLDRSYTEVNIIVDGTSTTALSLNRKDTTTGWRQYTIYLKPYATGQCVLIQFETMNIFDTNSVQYLGHITITSTPDLAVSSIIVSPEISTCELDNKDLSVVITTMVNQLLDFSLHPTDLAVEVPGYDTLFMVSLQHVIAGNSSDTIHVAHNVTIPSGVSTIRAYLTSPIDAFSSNDSTSIVVDIQPALSVTINPVTNMNSRIKTGAEVWQEAIIKNTGNVDIPNIELILRITGTNQEIIRETLPMNLAAGESYTHTFVNSYIVPEDERYQVSLIAYLECDSALVNTGDAIDEYVDLHNLSIVSIDNPPAGQFDTIGARINIIVSLTNTDDINSFKQASIYAVIENEEGEELINRWGTIEEILPLDIHQFTFRESYTVPEDSVYRIRIYLGKVDNYPENDTIEMIRRTVKENISVKEIDGSNIFTLGQNIPNPANNRTRIDYSIPESGEVVFNLHSISGQLLYSKTIEAASGKQSLELNTSSFAAGIYFYSIEYKGQRLVKRMMINN